eukprot:1872278-Amphidinium_carterae.1
MHCTYEVGFDIRHSSHVMQSVQHWCCKAVLFVNCDCEPPILAQLCSDLNVTKVDFDDTLAAELPPWSFLLRLPAPCLAT